MPTRDPTLQYPPVALRAMTLSTHTCNAYTYMTLQDSYDLGGDGLGSFWDMAANRLAASIINAHQPHIFSTSAVGVVLSPSRVQGGVRCAYSADGNSMSKGRIRGRDDDGCHAARWDAFMGSEGVEPMMWHHRTRLAGSTYPAWTADCLWGEHLMHACMHACMH